MSRDLVPKEQKTFVTSEKEVKNLRYFVWFETNENIKILTKRTIQFYLSEYGVCNEF